MVSTKSNIYVITSHCNYGSMTIFSFPKFMWSFLYLMPTKCFRHIVYTPFPVWDSLPLDDSSFFQQNPASAFTNNSI